MVFVCSEWLWIVALAAVLFQTFGDGVCFFDACGWFGIVVCNDGDSPVGSISSHGLAGPPDIVEFSLDLQSVFLALMSPHTMRLLTLNIGFKISTSVRYVGGRYRFVMVRSVSMSLTSIVIPSISFGMFCICIRSYGRPCWMNMVTPPPCLSFLHLTSLL